MSLKIQQLLPGAAMVIMIWWNISAVYPRLAIPPLIEKIGWAARLDQAWNMFDQPFTADGWYVISGQLGDGKTVDVLRDGPLNWDKPARVALMYHNERWRKFFMTLWQPFMSPVRPLYATWLCRQWNDQHPPGEQITGLEIFFMHETTLPAGSGKPYPERLIMIRCNR